MRRASSWSCAPGCSGDLLRFKPTYNHRPCCLCQSFFHQLARVAESPPLTYEALDWCKSLLWNLSNVSFLPDWLRSINYFIWWRTRGEWGDVFNHRINRDSQSRLFGGSSLAWWLLPFPTIECFLSILWLDDCQPYFDSACLAKTPKCTDLANLELGGVPKFTALVREW